jgi:hypothetical protein
MEHAKRIIEITMTFNLALAVHHHAQTTPDALAMTRLVLFLEDSFDIDFGSMDSAVDLVDSVNDSAALVDTQVASRLSWRIKAEKNPNHRSIVGANLEALIKSGVIARGHAAMMVLQRPA